MAPQESVWRRGGEASHFFLSPVPPWSQTPPQGRAVDIWSAPISSHRNDSDEITLSLSAAAAHPCQLGLNPGLLRQRAGSLSTGPAVCRPVVHKRTRTGGEDGEGVQDALTPYHPLPPSSSRASLTSWSVNSKHYMPMWALIAVTDHRLHSSPPGSGFAPSCPAPIWDGQREGAGRLVWRGQSFARGRRITRYFPTERRKEKKERKKKEKKIPSKWIITVEGEIIGTERQKLINSQETETEDKTARNAAAAGESLSFSFFLNHLWSCSSHVWCVGSRLFTHATTAVRVATAVELMA